MTSWCSKCRKRNWTRVKEKVRELMQGVAKLEVPLIVDVGVGANWDQAH